MVTVPTDTIARFTPAGRLRASINLGNPILAGTDPATGEPRGVSIDLARAFAERLGMALDLVVFDTAAKSVQAVADEQADIGFFAIDPLRGASIAFTPPYVLIEGCYLVREGSTLRANEEVDAPGRSVVVGQGSAYDLFLTRELKAATLVRAPRRPPWCPLSSSATPMWRPVSSNSSKPMPRTWTACACCPAASW